MPEEDATPVMLPLPMAGASSTLSPFRKKRAVNFAEDPGRWHPSRLP
jgi:hypothetical protein